MSIVKTVSVSDFKAEFKNQAPLCIDVRTKKEFASFHVEGAINMPLLDLEAFEIRALADLSSAPEKPVYFLCHSGKRAETAAKLMGKKLDLPIWVVEGGTVACIDAGMAILRTKDTISLERQIRIVTGGLVVLGVVLGALVHPAFYGFSALVGCAQMFAGVTGSCVIGTALSRMSWNQAIG